MLIESRSSVDPELVALFTAEQREMLAYRAGPAFAAGDQAAYLVAAVDGRAVACAAWQPLGAGVAELRRVYVRPAYRGRGIARQLVVAVEEDALAAGRPAIRLATGRTPAAPITLYRSCGYQPIPAYGEHADDPDCLCFGKRLAALV